MAFLQRFHIKLWWKNYILDTRSYWRNWFLLLAQVLHIKEFKPINLFLHSLLYCFFLAARLGLDSSLDFSAFLTFACYRLKYNDRGQRRLGRLRPKGRKEGGKGLSWGGGVGPTATKSQNTSQNLLKETTLKTMTMINSDSSVSVSLYWEQMRIMRNIKTNILYTMRRHLKTNIL